MTQQDLLGLGFFLSLAAVPLIALAWVKRNCSFSWVQYALWLACNLLVKFRWNARIPDWPLAKGQGAVVICNHRSSIDPSYLQAAIRWPMHWMVAREFCDHKLFAGFLEACEVIPTRRGGVDTAAVKSAIRLAREGGVIGMFPEGRINMTDRLMLPCRPGAALIAIKAQVPLVPCYIDGSPYRATALSPLLMNASVDVKFGEPIYPSANETDAREGEAEQLMLQCLQSIAALAGKEEYDFQMAGRRWKPSPNELKLDMERQKRRL